VYGPDDFTWPRTAWQSNPPELTAGRIVRVSAESAEWYNSAP